MAWIARFFDSKDGYSFVDLEEKVYWLHDPQGVLMEKWTRKRFLSNSKQNLFLTALRQHPNVTQAAQKAGLRSTAALYAQRRIDPDFAQEWANIMDERLDELEAALWKDALVRPEDRRWILSRLRPEIWGKKRRITIDADVKVKKGIEKLSDEELMAFIRQAGGQIEE